MKRTVLFNKHIELGGRMVPFAGWEMPVQYGTGILEEHLVTRNGAGLFDISHMGRFIIRGKNALQFLQHVLTSNAAALIPGKAQYTIIPDYNGTAIDDAYLYRFNEEEYLLVVNAVNTHKDLKHLENELKGFSEVILEDETDNIVMLSLQGPDSKKILSNILDSKDQNLPEPFRNELSSAEIDGKQVLIARTGYTGEPLGFELFIKNSSAEKLWDKLINKGSSPAGLGSRDSLRLEAGLPLYGHELGLDSKNTDIPIFASPLSRFAVSFNPAKGEFIGRETLWNQFEEYNRILNFNFTNLKHLKRIILPITITGKGIARNGDSVYKKGKFCGRVTSGTVVPYWEIEGKGVETVFTGDKERRAIALALIESSIQKNDDLTVEIRGKQIPAVVVPFHLRSEAPPFARAVMYSDMIEKTAEIKSKDKSRIFHDVDCLLKKTIENTEWRQKECINLIPSEMTQSPMTRLLSVMDPAFRYAEHKKVRAFYDTDIFYYQGTDFIDEVENLVSREMRIYLECTEVESRIISGQMSNMAVFSALLDYKNRGNRKIEQKRLRYVMNNHIIKGGHLSAQPLGALHDFVARDPVTDKPAVINFPVQKSNPYKMDLTATAKLLDYYKPELIILGKSMIIHKEPAAEIRNLLSDLSIDALLMYDMAHVLGLIGRHFQEPFKEGVDIVTGSTHKTFFGTQRGIIAANINKEDRRYPFWETIERRTFPGSVSNHHLGTLLGLLISCYEINYFKDEYQKRVISNAKAFALALAEAGMDVAGDPEISYTETHQVIVNVGYSKGIEAAKELEKNNIIVNFQAAPDEEGFTASGALRLGVSEMTRFGFSENDFKNVAGLIGEVISGKNSVKDKVVSFRKNFTDLKFCFSEKEYSDKIEKLHGLI